MQTHMIFPTKFAQGFYIWCVTKPQVNNLMKLTFKNFIGYFEAGPGTQSANLLLFEDRIPRSKFYAVATHELGHLLGLRHIHHEKAIMHGDASGTYISHYDIAELCSIYHCYNSPTDKVDIIPENYRP